MTFVTCPILRYHPVIVAQQAATLGVLSGGRFTLGLGAGENLNEHVIGRGWPPVDTRHLMFEEAVEIIKALLEGGYVTYHGAFFDADSAKLYDLPDGRIPIGVAASGRRSARIAAQHADCLIVNEPLGDVVDTFTAAVGQRMPVYGQLAVAYDDDADVAKQRAHRLWRWAEAGSPTWHWFRSAMISSNRSSSGGEGCAARAAPAVSRGRPASPRVGGRISGMRWGTEAAKKEVRAVARNSMTATPVQTAATVVAVIFLLVGVLGFIPGITTDFDMLEFAGHESGAMLLGIFQVSVLHNIVHLLFGIVGLPLARSATGAWYFLVVGGVIYLVLWLYGLLVDMESTANFVPFNEADNWLHLGLGVGMIALGLLLGRARTQVAQSP